MIMNIKKDTAVFLLLAAVMGLFSGCGGDTDKSPSENKSSSELLSYKAESVQLPNGMVRSRTIRVQDSTLYTYDNTAVSEEGQVIYGSDLEGNILHSYLVDSTDGAVVDFYPEEGGLWVMTTLYDELESGEETYLGTNLVHFRDDETSMAAMTTNVFAVEGIASTPLNVLVDRQRECIYLVGTHDFIALDYEGNRLFSISSAGIYSDPCFTSEGSLAICDYVNGTANISILDYDNQGWIVSDPLKIKYGKMYGGADYELYVSDGESLYGVNLESGECEQILQWMDVGIGVDLYDVYVLGNNTYLAATDNDVVLLSPTDEADDRAVLTMATFAYDEASSAALLFNESQSEYRIVIKDYSTFDLDTSNEEGLNQLNLDIASGSAPDLYDLRCLPVSKYVKDGLLEDIYPYIDATPDMQREDFFESIISAMEINGGLYYVMPHVSILTLFASPDTVAADEWSFSTMLKLAEQGDPFGNGLTRYDFIQYMLAGYDSPFVDQETATCSFNTEKFMDILEIAKSLPEEPIESDTYEVYDAPALILSKVASTSSIIYNSAVLGCLDDNNKAVSLGLPGADAPRFLITPSDFFWGMSSTSDNKEGAWEFMRYFLLEEYQGSNNLPILKSSWEAFREDEEQWIAAGGDFWMIVQGQEFETKITDSTYLDTLENLINSATGVYEENTALMEIIWSEAQAYFAGDKTAEQTADNIQSRVSIYLAEQG